MLKRGWEDEPKKGEVKLRKGLFECDFHQAHGSQVIQFPPSRGNAKNRPLMANFWKHSSGELTTRFETAGRLCPATSRSRMEQGLLYARTQPSLEGRQRE